ncbi:hypothetical protein TRFO_41047 [Tritrichomonas foetus]|uniref:Uncharacterized protein n=1 Tax=Tritrichomonas foetus TaxID=1144522 RepID=A0A1J4L2Q6_9EUKA|nr:hypothetical protein TRFO_41047 [Tritrichomonas foetus]|eukprot:OHT17376.1 hypothetical protein TRFO_41047 [Tritrichomonas foetus]
MLLLSLLSLISANLSNPSNAAIFVNTTDTVTIDKMGELKYEIGPGANGVEFVFVKSTLLYLTGVSSEKIKITFTFHDDDYHNTPFFLETNNIDITFNCDDPIVFSLRTLNAHKTIFGSTKKVNGHITSNSDCIFDYESFVSAFGPGGVFSTADGGLFSDYHSELQVDLPEDLLEITFSTSAFFVELQNGEKDSFSSVLEKNFNVILKSDLEEITIDASTSTIEGNITILAPKAIITATDRFKNVATATFPVSISCEIILLPYESLPDNIFTFVNEDLEPKDDQIIMMDGYRRYCLYKESSTKCDIHGTIPKAYSSAITVETGKFISYTICTSEAPTIIHDTNSASSLEIIGNNDSRDVNLQIKDVNALSGNFSLENVNIAFTAPQTQLNIKNVFIGKDVTFPNPQQWKMVDFVVSESFNSTFDWYLNFVESLTFDLDLEPNAKIGLYEFNNIENLVITESELKLCYGTSADDCLKFETDSNNRVIVHTNDLKFDLDPAGAKTIFGNFELHIDTKIGDKAQISFFEDWQDV